MVRKKRKYVYGQNPTGEAHYAKQRMPLCHKCGVRHWNMVSCTQGAVYETLKVRPQWRTVPDGHRPWGDDLATIRRIGRNRFVVSNYDDAA
jgi:hypothetical protein